MFKCSRNQRLYSFILLDPYIRKVFALSTLRFFYKRNLYIVLKIAIIGERDLEVIVAKVTGKILEPKAHTLDYAEFCN